MQLKIKNRDARRLWLESQGLSQAPTGDLDLLQIIKNLGFVQLDSIRNVTRAHHHILWSRNQNYREPMLWDLLKNEREIFEHFTHDASLIPMDFYPMWKRQFPRMKQKLVRSWYTASNLSEAEHEAIKKRIETEGPLSTRAFDTKIEGKKEMWKRPPHKKALDYMWYCGELTTSHRENFIKFYDLPHKVIPADKLEQHLADNEQVDWLCHAAIERLGFGSISDIRNFWAATDLVEVKRWIENTQSIVPVQIENHDGSWTDAYAKADIEGRLAQVLSPTSRMRIINPFDPSISDRDRLKRLFGIDFKIEIFVPAAKRLWGYYVYPILEIDKFIARIELKANRTIGTLNVHQFWLEPKTIWSGARSGKLNAELTRLARLTGCSDVQWLCDQPSTG